jgi:hypothetical protein
MAHPANTSRQFWARVAPPNERGCMLWTGRTRGAYGVFHIQGYNIGAHRYTWEVTNGPIPDGLLVCHVCDVPLCCNVHHLFLGTYADNSADMVRKGRSRSAGRGDDSPLAKLTDVQIAEIRMRALAGEQQKSLATEFGVSRALVCRLVRNKHRRVSA